MKKIIILLIAILTISTASAQLADSPWPMYHGGPKHGGQSSVDTSNIGGKIKWTFQAGDGIETSPVIGEDGTIYFGAHDNKLYAVNPDGTLKWSFYVGKEPSYDDVFDVYKGILSTPAVAKDGTIYFSSLSDIFFALNPDGTEKWRHELPITSDTWTSPVIAEDGTIYIGSASRKLEGSDWSEYFDPPIGGVYAFNPDGTLKWHFEVAGDMAGSIAIGDDGTIYAFTSEEDDKKEADGYLKALTPNGKEIWKYHIEFSESSPTVAPDGTIYMGAGHDNRGFVALNSDGTEKWFFTTPNDISLIPAIASDGTIYVGEWDGMFYAFNPDGSIKWTFETLKGYESLISSPAMGVEGTIYFGSREGLYALNPDGTEKWHYMGDIENVVSSPAIASDGTIYVGGLNGKLYAFGEGEIAEADKQSTIPYEASGQNATCPDGIWDEREQANPMMCPPDNPNLSEEERRTGNISRNVRENYFEERIIPEDLYEEPKDERSLITRFFDWFRRLFGKKDYRDYGVSELPPKQSLKEVCLTPEEYEQGEPILSIPFNLDDYYTKNWGIIPFCADPWASGNTHNAIDFELNSKAKVYAAADGKVISLGYSDIEGAGEIMQVKGDGYSLDYSGLKDIRVKIGEEMKKGDYIADVYETPFGEYHVHLGISLDKGPECPIKYMDEEFKEALREMFAQAHYLRQDEQPCACNCESLVSIT